MTAEQNAAFQAGSGVTASTLLTAIASIVLVLALVWVIWVTLGSFRAWQDGQISLFDLTWATLRASIVLLVLGFYLR
ncbi:MAG: TIGR03758 family integrating conjugative element protein [Gammaproteobacteria bacterium]|nr:TIGR03758 family integrating conjugative element protein [Gammaproteobacteria bacterium]|tara:strand:- start:2446 stop:2676 length:231 start_codon:yes stop_codon:yes gene_type:complete